MKTFQDLKFKKDPIAITISSNRFCAIEKFDNGHFIFAYTDISNKDKLYDVIVTDADCEDIKVNLPSFPNESDTSSVYIYLTSKDVTRLMEEVQSLPNIN